MPEVGFGISRSADTLKHQQMNRKLEAKMDEHYEEDDFEASFDHWVEIQRAKPQDVRRQPQHDFINALRSTVRKKFKSSAVSAKMFQ